MSPPPINMDDSEITGASIDGQEVQEITVDGDVVFSAGPNGSQSRPADSALQLKNLGFSTGTYFIKTPSGATETFCDMSNIDGGGWTLIGKSGFDNWNAPDLWLKSNQSTNELLDTDHVPDNSFACMDSRRVAADFSTEVAFSDSTRSKWVYAPLHSQVSQNTIFNHSDGHSTINNSAQNNSEQVTVEGWNNRSDSGFVNKYMVMALDGHGGSTPAWTRNRDGNTDSNDIRMACSCATQDHNGFGASNRYNGQDAPINDNDWPNGQFDGGNPRIFVWAR